mmetsp:Transcript_40982/g.80186  ORF Transcript_40982/g.80186 Transcript_40982/m.80186 type:complete len:264 (-) Transcript_40982:205-996(-)
MSPLRKILAFAAAAPPLIAGNRCGETVAFAHGAAGSCRSLVRAAAAAPSGVEGGTGERQTGRRRQFLLWAPTFAAAAAGTSTVAVAEDTTAATMRPFMDKEFNFRIDIPSEWSQSTKELDDRRKLELFIDPKDSTGQTSLFIAYTPVAPDFTSLGAFGDVASVGETTILPKGKIQGVTDTEGTMLSSKSVKSSYQYDYVVKIATQPERHLRTIFALQSAVPVEGAPQSGFMLVTITAQTTEDNYVRVRDIFNKIVDSYDKAGK